MKAPSEARPAIAQPAIKLAGVNLSLGQGAARVHILKDIGLNIGSGEAIGLVGPSGSGKSTLLMVMAGLERTDTGSVTVTGAVTGPDFVDCGRWTGKPCVMSGAATMKMTRSTSMTSTSGTTLISASELDTCIERARLARRPGGCDCSSSFGIR
jgi:ABC-type polysaccharide/polyol phosphate transport system ATPase subunit